VVVVVGRLGVEVCLRSFGKDFVGTLDRISFWCWRTLDWTRLGIGPGTALVLLSLSS
jgi:hypothetical protein